MTLVSKESLGISFLRALSTLVLKNSADLPFMDSRFVTEFYGKLGEFCEKLGEFALAHK